MSATSLYNHSGLTTLRIPAMDCAAEEADIRRALESLEGIRSLRFQLTSRTLAIEAPQVALEAAVAAIGQAGYQVLPDGAGPAARGQAGHAHDRDGHTHAQGDGHGHDHVHGHVPAASTASTASAAPAAMEPGLPPGIGRLVAALVLAVGAELLAFFAPDALAWKGLGMGVALAAILLAGLDVYQKGVRALWARRLNISALMAVAVTGAFLIGQWPEAAMVMALYAIAEAIEALAVDRARNAIRNLMALAPDEAEVRRDDGGWTNLPLAQVPVGATVRVRPGGRVPMDGVVTAGSSAVNQASVTGESIPVDKSVGDSVFAGTVSETGELALRVTAAAGDSTLARIIHAVEHAQGSRAPTQKFVDRFAAVYTPLVFVIALAVALGMPPVFGWPWLEALYKALVLLVIACPCALVISTPVTVVSGLTAAARRGMLIKGGTYLEEARLLRVVALDKTGTITAGKPVLVDWQPWSGADGARAAALAASLAARSDHPVSRAIATGLQAPSLPVEDFQALPGRGVQGQVGMEPFVLGNHRLAEERQQCSPGLEAALARHEAQGRTVALLMGTSGVQGVFAVADTIREHAPQAIAELQALGVEPVMLSGDNQATAEAIARQAGLHDARGNLLPQDKLDAIEDLRRRRGPTAMVGDGINDAPALARADIGFAMGGAGTDVAMEAADVVVMNDDLLRVAETVRLSRRTHAVLWQNIGLALGIKAVFLVLALSGSASMWMAVFADMGASLLVVANGLRLLRPGRQPWARRWA